MDWGVFERLTSAQAEVISAAITLLSAVVVAVVAPVTFHLLTRRGVRSFEQTVESLAASAKRAEDQVHGIRSAIGRVHDTVGEFSELLASLQESVANTQNAMVENAQESAPSSNGQQANRDLIKALWRELQEVAEAAASDPSINGNTRAKYARLDRRSYLNLVAMLIDEQRLADTPEQWREAYSLWNTAIRSNSLVQDGDVARMRNLVSIIKSAQQGLAAARQSFQAALRKAPPRAEFRRAGDGDGREAQLPN